MLATFEHLETPIYRRHFFGGKVDPNCTEQLLQNDQDDSGYSNRREDHSLYLQGEKYEQNENTKSLKIW